MLTFVARRLLLAVPTTLGVCTLLFFALHAAPGNPADHFVDPDMQVDLRQVMEHNLGLDRPLGVQYFRWIGAMLRLDFGYSFFEQRPVLHVLADALPNTLLLCGLAFVVIFGVGVFLGTLTAGWRGTALEAALTTASLVVYAVPGFILALLLVLVFAYWWPVFPSSGVVAVDHEFRSVLARFWDHLAHLVLPVIALSAAPAAGVARYTRASMLEVLGQDHVRAARSRGISGTRLLLRHGLRNALLPLITLLGLYLPFLLSGTVLIESVFAYPGMGKLTVDSILSQDFPVVLGNSVIYTFAVIGGNLCADVLYAFADPRTRQR